MTQFYPPTAMHEESALRRALVDALEREQKKYSYLENF